MDQRVFTISTCHVNIFTETKAKQNKTKKQNTKIYNFNLNVYF